MQRAFQHARNFLDAVAQFARGGGQHTLGHMAGESNDQHREFGNIDLVDRRLLRRLRQIGFGILHLGARVLQRLGQIGRGIELDQHIATALECGRTHFLQALQAFELGLDGSQQQPLGIFRRDALIDQGNIHHRNRNVRFGFLGHRHIGNGACEQQEHQHRNGQPRILDGKRDDIHGVRSRKWMRTDRPG